MMRPAYEFPPGICVKVGDDCYVIGRILGQGGFGAVYSATLDGHRYALKVATDPIAQEKLQRESDISAILARFSAGTIPLRILLAPKISLPEGFGAGVNTSIDLRADISIDISASTSARPPISIGVMRDMSEAGLTLTDIIRSPLRGAKGLIAAVDLMLALLRALEPIHNNEHLRYLHGDISPENIIFAPAIGAAFFIDFGNAWQLDAHDQAIIPRDELTYNPLYMSPELRSFIIAEEEDVRLSKASDIYSLAMIFHVALFGPLDPSTCEHAAILSRNRVNSCFGASGSIRDQVVAPLLMAFFEDCLALDARDRLQDVKMMGMRLEELRNVASGCAFSLAGLRARVIENGIFAQRARFAALGDQAGSVVDGANGGRETPHTPLGPQTDWTVLDSGGSVCLPGGGGLYRSSGMVYVAAA